jgi:hypothetical protein
MAFYNSGFPATYQPLYQPYQQPVMQQPVSPTQMSGANQMMTPPTIRAEIVQVKGEDAASTFPVNAGASQMMISQDESEIYIKSATANGFTLDVYVKRPPAPPAPKFDPSEYVRKDEMEKLIKDMIANRQKKQEVES